MALSAMVLFLGCQPENEMVSKETSLAKDDALALKFDAPSSGVLTEAVRKTLATQTAKSGGEIEELTLASDQFSAINERLKPQGIALLRVESMNERAPVIVFDRQFELNLTSGWVRDDPRRGNGLSVTYNVTPFFNIANGTLPTEAITDDAYARWNNSTCGSATLEKENNPGIFNSTILTLGGVPGDPFSDINVLGHVPGFVFGLIDGLSPDGTLGVAFTFVFIDEDGNPTDIDNDGKSDTSLKEVWYNDDFTWTDDISTAPGIDLASVITHESGHTLEAGHFGIGILNARENGSIDYFPRAVMNALYFEPISDLRDTDRAAYCNTFGDWWQ